MNFQSRLFSQIFSQICLINFGKEFGGKTQSGKPGIHHNISDCADENHGHSLIIVQMSIIDILTHSISHCADEHHGHSLI